MWITPRFDLAVDEMAGGITAPRQSQDPAERILTAQLAAKSHPGGGESFLVSRYPSPNSGTMNT
jgi:hypothetical protein